MTTSEILVKVDGQAAFDEEGVTSSFSQQSLNCLALRRMDSGMVEVGDTKDPDGPRLRFSPSEMAAFLLGAEQREFDNFVMPDKVEPPEFAEAWRLYLERSVGQPVVAQTVETVHAQLQS